MEVVQSQGQATLGQAETDDDLDLIEGRREELEGKIQQRYGYAKDKVRSEIDT